MIFKKALSLVAAVAAMAAAAAVCVIAAAFALYAFARYYLGPAGGAAVVAALAAVAAVLLAFLSLRQFRERPKPLKPEEQTLTTRLIDLARDRPIIAAGAAVAAGLVLLRNPRLLNTVLTAVLASRAGRAVERAERRR